MFLTGIVDQQLCYALLCSARMPALFDSAEGFHCDYLAVEMMKQTVKQTQAERLWFVFGARRLNPSSSKVPPPLVCCKSRPLGAACLVQCVA